MNWLPDLLKNISVSRPVAGALFIATAAMLSLPVIFPQHFPEVPAEWRWLVAGVGLFSGALLLIWALSAVGKAISKTSRAARQLMPQRQLTDLEATFLAILGKRDPNGALNLDDLDHSNISKLEMFQMCKGLESLGFVELNPWHKELISLTDKGRETALKILRQAKA